MMLGIIMGASSANSGHFFTSQGIDGNLEWSVEYVSLSALTFAVSPNGMPTSPLTSDLISNVAMPQQDLGSVTLRGQNRRTVDARALLNGLKNHFLLWHDTISPLLQHIVADNHTMVATCLRVPSSSDAHTLLGVDTGYRTLGTVGVLQSPEAVFAPHATGILALDLCLPIHETMVENLTMSQMATPAPDLATSLHVPPESSHISSALATHDYSALPVLPAPTPAPDNSAGVLGAQTAPTVAYADSLAHYTASRDLVVAMQQCAVMHQVLQASPHVARDELFAEYGWVPKTHQNKFQILSSATAIANLSWRDPIPEPKTPGWNLYANWRTINYLFGADGPVYGMEKPLLSSSTTPAWERAALSLSQAALVRMVNDLKSWSVSQSADG
ncbi:hypothetical protein BD626DRAFT_631208 [Schizophyllum amplum]|uniref:Uncharacterized protein n=1 Tax=Schizophyllum amplum TaxID=97359 RepID=A0A550CB38_9AGAR|nr:hypothetical protein BD626DRAFT_631208 [Auriculariopsis ampla]